MSDDRRRVAIGEAFRRNGFLVKTREKCGGSEGSFYCVSCAVDITPLHVPVAYEHDAPRPIDHHCDQEGKPHVIAWICSEHGPEVP